MSCKTGCSPKLVPSPPVMLANERDPPAHLWRTRRSCLGYSSLSALGLKHESEEKLLRGAAVQPPDRVGHRVRPALGRLSAIRRVPNENRSRPPQAHRACLGMLVVGGNPPVANPHGGHRIANPRRRDNGPYTASVTWEPQQSQELAPWHEASRERTFPNKSTSAGRCLRPKVADALPASRSLTSLGSRLQGTCCSSKAQLEGCTAA